MTYIKHISTAYKQKKPFVAFKNPNENRVEVIIQDSDELIVFDNFSVSGYVFAPFDDNDKAYILKPDFYFIDDVQPIDLSIHDVVTTNIDDKENHINIVDKTIKAIQNTELSKVVISRKEEVAIANFDLINVYNKLLNKYPNAYVYVWYHPKVGLWMGATPETLLNVVKNNFTTMALAGTQAYNGEVNPIWGEKELEEQQMVEGYIKHHLKDVVDHLKLSDVQTVKSGNLLHLKTNITGGLRNSKDISALVKLLHPTPAVCGLPKEISKQFILENENYDRKYYSGYLGVLNINDKTSFYVNLRCLEYINNKIYLYMGGGITASSNAENEWYETVAKSEVIKSVL